MSSKYLFPLLAGLGMSGVVFLVEGGLAHVGMPGEKTFLDEALLGIFAALALFFLLRYRDSQRELNRQKHYASVIGDLNHHIRNAMQVIVYRTEIGLQGIPELQEIREAVNRIDWALREILPRAGSPGAPTPQNDPASPKTAPPAPRIDPE